METSERTVPRTFEVTWSMIYEAASPEEAVRIALGDLATVLAQPTEGPNFFLVSGDDIELTVVSADEIDTERPNDD
jgi:hypothetical protein